MIRTFLKTDFFPNFGCDFSKDIRSIIFIFKLLGCSLLLFLSFQYSKIHNFSKKTKLNKPNQTH